MAVVFTGGTIAMRVDAAAGGAVPSLDGAALLARTPGLDAIADVEAIDWGLVPASHLSFAQILDIAATVRAALARPEIEGAVVVQGTDTIEEVAFALDLLVRGAKPVVVVGAMRNADDAAYDGPRNIRDAVRAATAGELRDAGAVVVMAGRVLPAEDAIKVDSQRLDTFDAPNRGAIGTVHEDGVRIERVRGERRMLPVVPTSAAEPVFLVTATVAMAGSLVRAARPLAPRGWVVAATGTGNTDADLLAACRDEIAHGVPVVLTSRCLSGGVHAAYGFPGGGVTWQRAGAILGGTLSGPKARVALALGLGAGLDDDALRRLFVEP